MARTNRIELFAADELAVDLLAFGFSNANRNGDEVAFRSAKVAFVVNFREAKDDHDEGYVDG